MKGFMRLIFSVLVVFFSIKGHGCAGEIQVFVSILPQKYFVERIGEPFVKVDVLVEPGDSPATYDPTMKQLTALGKADIYFRIGVPFENKLIEKISAVCPDLKIVDTRKGVPLLHFDTISHGGSSDPHIWLDPKRVKLQAVTMCESLSAVDGKNKEHYGRNLAAFQSDLDRLDAKISAILGPLRGRPIYVFHPAFGYFADSYGLRQMAIQTGGKEPSPKQLARLIENAKNEGVKVLFVQPQFSSRCAETIARQIGGNIVPLDSLPQDYEKNLEEMAIVIKKGFETSQTR
ncbi:MAG: zinc ABC transporter substrate-binding protein [Syntrophales bacterium]|nr:zinc ABC transporter substrate-binding protein [Syntrophales bacterium]